MKRLRKEVGDVVNSSHERDSEAVILDQLAHVEVAAVDMLHAPMVLGVVGDVDGGLVVEMKVDGAAVVKV